MALTDLTKETFSDGHANIRVSALEAALGIQFR